MRNTLYYGDNLDILRKYLADASVDLIYLDPPFNSNRSYSVLFKNEGGVESEASVRAFNDTWHWGQSAEDTYHALVTEGSAPVSNMIVAMRQFIGTNQMMAYLVMMAARLVELHRVLKPTGSIYLHCDPTASHYLRMLLDTIFGTQNFRNEITWQRSDTHNDAKRQFPSISDHILFYTKSNLYTFNKQHKGHAIDTLRQWYLYLEMSDGSTRRMTKEEIETQTIPAGARRFNTGDMTSPNPRPNLMYEYKGYSHPPKGWRYSRESMEELDRKGLLLFPVSPDGRIMRKRYLDEQSGSVIGDAWIDISQLRAHDAELLGYPTQKPVALLERIISASSNPGDIVLDPFCGCGTTIAAAQKLNRRWIGIDITNLAISLQKYRLKDAYGLEAGKDYLVIGQPQDLASAVQLSKEDRHQFEWWALSLIQAQPITPTDDSGKKGKKGADKGIDGQIVFVDDSKGKAKRVIVQVKSGHVSASIVRDLRGVIEREGAAMGVLITLDPPSLPMKVEAASAGHYTSPGWNRTYPRLQILTVEGLLAGVEHLDRPPTATTFKQAQKEEPDKPTQPGLGLE